MSSSWFHAASVSPYSTVSLIIVALCLLYLWYTKLIPSLPLPPGPKPIPFIGNVHQLPTEHQEKASLSWGHKYCELVYAKLFGRPVLVTNSINVARDLMEKRGAIYSDRPRFVLMGEMLDTDGSVPIMPYGDRFLRSRKWIQDAFSVTIMTTYQYLQRRETNVLLIGFLARPDTLASHFAIFTEALILEITYGHRVVSDNDTYIELGKNGNEAIATIGSPGSMLVDFFPILKYYPTWLPGSAFKKRAIRARGLVKAMVDIPYNAVKSQVQSCDARPSFAANLLEDYLHEGKFRLSAKDEVDIKGASLTLFSAGTKTMASVMNTFVLAMVIHPQIYQTAQKELGQVVGTTRLPELSDRVSLPYLNRIIKEVYRWHPPLPLGLPHYSTEDDEYRGYSISKGTLIIGNIWGISRDEVFYPEPEKFNPERFMDPSQEGAIDPKTFIFGFGRRICPGKDFADSCVFLVLANIIATMNIEKVKDKHGRDITPSVEFTDGFASRPKPFSCVLTPRSREVVELICQQDAEEGNVAI